MKIVPCILFDDWKTRITLKKKDSKLWYWEVFHIPTTRKNKERYDRRLRANQELKDWWIEFGSEMGFHEWYKRWYRAYRKTRKELRR